jgi:hypothetical protein
MKRQVWQECHCGLEPVCVDCERCAVHCRCVEDDVVDPRQAALRARIAEHLAQGGRTN